MGKVMGKGEPSSPVLRRLGPWSVLALTLVLLGVAVLAAYQQHSKYERLREQVEMACQGTVAHLDISDWVPLCLTVQ